MKPTYADDWLTVYGGDCREVMASMEPESVHCVVTSPPYWGLRDYGVTGQLGLEPTPEEYVVNLVGVFREVRRVLRSDGTLWLNLGDSYASGEVGRHDAVAPTAVVSAKGQGISQGGKRQYRRPDTGLKPKDLVGIPWRVALALQADGWYLRSDIIWSKPNPMPESVTDRPTKSHEYLFLLSKSPRYYYDAEAIGEPVAESTVRRLDEPTLAEQRGSSRVPGKTNGPMKAVPPRFGGAKYGDDGSDPHRTKSGNAYHLTDKRNARTVWTVATQPYRGAHFAVFPEKLIEPPILAGCPTLGVVLDPFAGSGTVGRVAQRLSRRAVLIDLNPEYLVQAMDRNADIPLGLGA